MSASLRLLLLGPAAALAVAAAALPLAGCPARRAYQEELSQSPPGEHHAVHTERLEQVMRGLDRLSEERLPQGVDVESSREARIAELVEVANAIAASAERIPAAAWAEGSLTNPQRVAFHQHAARLRDRALALADGAPTMTPEARAEAVAGLRDACDACHAEFRAPRDPDGS
jgi:cytochrome c556